MINDYNFKFMPKQLIVATEVIKKRHQKVNERYKVISLDEERLRNIIKELEKLDDNELSKFAYLLTKDELCSLANYMVKNIYNTDLEKIYKVLKLRPRDEYLLIFFDNFQNYYTNREFNLYFRRFLQEFKDAYKILAIDEKALSDLIEWLKERHIVEQIVQSYFKLDIDFDDYMLTYRFKNKFSLYGDCKRYLYINCNADVYLRSEVEDILDTLKTCNRSEIVGFINNYLIKLDIQDFDENIMNYIYFSYGRPDDVDLIYTYIWSEILDKAKEKYNIWFAQRELNEFFQGDERYTFWFEYVKALKAKILAINERQLFLDFGNFVVIEFKDWGNAAYIYDKNIFRNNFLRYLKGEDTYSNAIFKNRVIMIDRITHGDFWQVRASKLIAKIYLMFS